MKKLLSFILVLIMVLSLCACGGEIKSKKSDKEKETTQVETAAETAVPVTEPETQTSGTSEITPLLYKVTDKDGDIVWLFGSIHIGMDYMYHLPNYVYNAFDNSDYLAVECDVVSAENDMEASTQLLMKLVYLDGTTIKDHLSPEVYEDAVEALTDAGYYNMYLDYYMPALWSTLLEQLNVEHFGFDMLKGVDRHLMARADEKEIELVEIESNEAHYEMMANYSEELQEILLEESVEYYKDDEYKEEVEKMLRIWCEGDEKRFSDYLASEDDELEPDEIKYYEEYNNAMIVERNLLMTDFAEDALKEGEEAFIVVGSAHVVGEGGMADQLKDRGYTVEVVK